MSTPKPFHETSKVVHSVGRKTHLKRNHKILFYNFPNYPMFLIRKDANSLEKEDKVSHRRDQIVTFIRTSEGRKSKEKEDSYVTNVAHEEHNELKNDLLDYNVMFDDLTKQSDDELRSKTMIIKSQEAETYKLRNELLLSNKNKMKLEEKLKSSRLAHEAKLGLKIRIKPKSNDVFTSRIKDGNRTFFIYKSRNMQMQHNKS